MDLKELQKIIDMFEKSDISSLELENNGLKIKMTKERTSAPIENSRPVEIKTPSQAPTATENVEEEVKEEKLGPGYSYITSPIVGIYHEAAFQGGDPFVKEGQKVKKGTTLCIVEAMKVMNEIKADKDGTIETILAKEGDMIEYGQNLFVIGE